MRIFLINSVCGTGSTGRIVTDIANILIMEGHEVKIAYGIGNACGIESRYVVKINNKVGYYTHNILSRFTDRAGFYSAKATKKLIDEIKKFRPDLIHLHNLHGYYLNVRSLFKYLKKANIPVIWTLHDCWALTGHCAHFSYVNCKKWKVGCDKCIQKSEYPKSYLLDQSKRNYMEKKQLFTSINDMTLVTPSTWLAEIVKESYLNKYPVYAIPNGIDLETFKKRIGNFKEIHDIKNKIMILAVANVWVEKKGMYDIFELSERLDKNIYQIVMVGVSKAQLNIVPDQIIAIERTESINELVNIYSEADIFINPSYEETMGLVTAEALACCTPCIVYDRTAVPEVIDGSCGIVVKAGNVMDMYEAIKKLEYKKMNGCRERAKKYEKNKQYHKYLELYKEVYN